MTRRSRLVKYTASDPTLAFDLQKAIADLRSLRTVDPLTESLARLKPVKTLYVAEKV